MIFKNVYKNLLSRDGQNMMEYVFVLGAVIMVIFAMQPLVKRGAQGVIKLVADQVGEQAEGEQSFEKETGYLQDSKSATRSEMVKHQTEAGGVVTYNYDDLTATVSDQSLILGFTKK